MQVSKKLIIALSIAITIFILVLYMVTHLFLVDTFSQIEKKRSYENSVRVDKAITRLINELSTTTNDWAKYDDAYDFVAGNNQKFVDDNINLEGLMTLNINAFTYFDLQGKAVLNVATNADYTRFITLPKEYSEQLTFPFLMSKLKQSPNQTLKGMIALPEGVLLVAASEVTNAARTQPVNGVLLAARYFSKSLVEQISDRTGLVNKLILLSDIQRNDELRMSFAKAKASEAGYYVTLKSRDRENIYGYVLMRDINQNPIALMEFAMPRSVYAVGSQAINYFMGAFIVVGIILSLLIWYLTHTFIVKRVEKLNDQLEYIGKYNDYSKRLKVHGSDELSSLTANFNGMMDIIQKSHQALLDKIEALSVSEDKLKNINTKLTREMQKKKIEEDRASLFNKKLLSQARDAGAAEVASYILHNIGNILNSVKVSVQHISKEDQSPILKKLDNVIKMLNANKHDLNTYLTTDAKGKLIPQYLAALADALTEDSNRYNEEIAHLQELIKHIEEIIALQKESSGV